MSVSDWRRGWSAYRPSKALWFWSCIGAAAATIVIGFTWGGWVTGGTAHEMAEDSATQARSELATAVCIERFNALPDARAQLAALKEQSWYARGEFVEERGWATMPDRDAPRDATANLCAERLVELELPAASAEMPEAADAAAAQQGVAPAEIAK